MPCLDDALDAVEVASVSLPIAVGLLLMAYAVLAEVRYGKTSRVTGDHRLLVTSLVLNWLVGRRGARRTRLGLPALGWFHLQVLPGWLGLSTTSAEFSVGEIVVSVLVFLGIPLLDGFLTRTLGERACGRDSYEGRFLPDSGPIALYGLLSTIVMLLALQGDATTSQPWDAARIALPLLAYFALMSSVSFVRIRVLRLSYANTATLSATAAGNNVELAIALVIGTFGVTSGQALAGVGGPLVEVPVLVALVHVPLWAGRRYSPGDATVPTREAARV